MVSKTMEQNGFEENNKSQKHCCTGQYHGTIMEQLYNLQANNDIEQINSLENNNQMSQKEFVEVLKQSFFELVDLSQMIKWIENTTKYLKNYSGLFNYYDELVKIYFILLKNAINDPFYKHIDQSLNEFFIQFQKKCLEWEIIDKSVIKHSSEWTDLIDEMIPEKFYATLMEVSNDNNFTLTTVPIALNTLIVIHLTYYPSQKSFTLFEKIFEIIQDRCDRGLPLDNIYWTDLVANIYLCVKIYSAIHCVNRFKDKEFQHLTLFLIEIGLNGDHFQKRLTRKSIRDLASICSISQIYLFLFFQKEISHLLIDKLQENFNINLLYECMDYFTIKSLPDELLCWIIPVFVVKYNEQSRLLLDHIQNLIQKPKISLIKQYLKDILIHLFYECQVDVVIIHQIIKFLTDYCQQDVFKLVHDLNKPLIDAFLQRISKNKDITFKALSFMIFSSKIEYDQLDSILKINLDFFSNNEEKFHHYLHQKFFIYYIHQFDRYLKKYNFNIIEKITLIQSFEIILQYLNEQYTNRFRVKIHFIIRRLLGENSNSNVKQLEIGLKIMDCFISKVEKDFLQNEIVSICFLIIPLVKQLPKESSILLYKLLTLYQYEDSIYYQLCFIPSDCNSLRAINDLINERNNRFVSETNNLINGQSLSPSSASLVDTNNNNNNKGKIEDGYKICNQNQLITYLKSVDFSLKCREIYFLLENIDNMNERLQKVMLQQLYLRLISNKDLFYKIYMRQSSEYYHSDYFLGNFSIDMKISTNRENNSESTTTRNLQITLSNFFRHIILRLLQCIKFSTSTEIIKLSTNCLGVLGAIDIRFLNFAHPFQKNDFNIINSNVIDYANHNLFQPKKRSFKLLILDILINMVKSSNTLTDYNCASFALQETLPFFADTSNDYFGLLTNDNGDNFDTQSAISTQRIERYVQNLNHKPHVDHPTLISSSQEMEQLNKCDQIKAFLQNEKNEFLNLDHDLNGELRYYRQILNISLFNSKELKKLDTIGMENFFNGINPTMSYSSFLKRFIDMLYHSFIIPHMKKMENSGEKCSDIITISQDYYEEMFTQLSSSVQRDGSTLMKEFQEIKAKIGRLQTPEKIFLVCYHIISSSSSTSSCHHVKLSYVLIPCLMLLSLGHGTDEMREQFAKHFKSMIETKFLQERMIFIYELGQMGGELLCYIYDYLKRWYHSRRLAHSVIINNKLFRERTVRNVDKEFHAIKLILDSVDSITMAKLAYEARSYSKSLFYLEQHYTELRMNDSTTLNDFIHDQAELYLKVYHALNDLDSINGLSVVQKQRPFPSIDHLFHQHLLDQDPTGQLICGVKLMSNRDLNKMYYFDIQEKYLKTLINLDQHLPPIFSKDYCSPNFYHYLLEATWKLNSWDSMLNSFDCSFFKDLFSLSNQSINFPWNESNQSNQTHCIPNFGYILSAMYKKESLSTLDTKFSNVRRSFLAPLNAALLSNTATAYAQSYQVSLVAIHIMHDLQQFASTIYNKLLINDHSNKNLQSNSVISSSDQIESLFDELIRDWRLRNNLLPNGPIRQQVLDVQRSLIYLLKNHKSSFNVSNELFRYWNESIRCSLDGGCLERAYISLIEAIHIRESSLNQSESNLINPITDSEHVEFILNEAQVFWIRNNQTTSIELLRTELEKRYNDIQKYCYMETLKNFSQMPEQDLYNLTNSLSLNLTKAQFQQMSTSSTFKLGASESLRVQASSPMDGGETSSSFIESIDQKKLKNYGRLQLRYAQYCEFAGQLNSYALIILYKSVTISCPQWEEAHFQLAMFYRRLYREYQNSGSILRSKTAYNIGKPDEILDLKARVIKTSCESLKFGSLKFVRISLPTLLNIWVDLGYECLAYQKKCRNNDQNRSLTLMKDLLRRVTERSTLLIRQMTMAVNNAIFFVDLDTLIGHMLHQFEPISKMIEDILIKLIADFPHHMAWQFSRSLNSTGRRSIKSKELIQAANKLINGHTYIVHYFEKFNYFSNCLNELARYKPPKSKSNDQSDSKYDLNLRRMAPNLIRSLQSEYKFALPCNEFFMPNSMNLERLSNKDPFFKSLYIGKIMDNAQVMKSLQMPKKLTFICCNGIKRMVLVKCGDDLRKDRAMLNLCNTFNQCHRGEIPIRNIEPMSNIESRFDMATEIKIWSRRRQQPLAIQTYFVVPLSDSYGVIEWIPGLQSLKTLVEGQYTRTRARAKKYFTAKTSFIKSVITSNLTREKRIERFNQSYPAFQPPVFQNWFYENYADSYSWHLARKNFTRTSAVFSILGYILGLCDRHAENILLDPTTGEVVHVDFNCLFNRGEEFMVPECVPFRLTQNMISAMGTLGYEGLFRATCEDVLLVLRQFRELFSQPITIFLFDIFADWLESSDRTEIAEKSVFNVEARLFGITSRTNRKLPKGNIMSISGQVDYVIKEATDLNNLGAMYHGWASFI